MRKYGFTLAEILIAMAIIGIVAALTIPSLSQAYQKRVLTTQLQRAYAELSQAGATVIADEMTDDFNTSKAIKDMNFIGKYLVIAQSRKDFADSYGRHDDPLGSYDVFIKMSDNEDDFKCGVTKAGAAVCVDKYGIGALDINGTKGPNLIGRDAYPISFLSDGTVSNHYIDSIIAHDWDIDKPGASEYTIVLVSYGNSKIAVLKAVKQLLGLGLKEAKDLIESVPVTIMENVECEEEAESIKKQLEDAGATVELQ